MKLESLRIITSLVGQQSNAKDLSTPVADLVKRIEQNYSDGTGADQAQVVFADSRTLAASATESLDLAGGLTHELGGAITLSAVKEIVISCPETNTGNMRFGANVTNGMQGPFGASAVGITLAPGGLLHIREPGATGWAVTAGTGDLLKAENLAGGNANSYDIILVGEGSVA